MDVFWQEDKGQKQMLFRQPPKCSVLGVKIRPRWQEQPPRKQTIVGLILGDHLDLVAWVPVIPKRLVLRCSVEKKVSGLTCILEMLHTTPFFLRFTLMILRSSVRKDLFNLKSQHCMYLCMEHFFQWNIGKLSTFHNAYFGNRPTTSAVLC